MIDAEKAKVILEKNMREIGKPFAGYKDFGACVSQNGSKDNQEGYCAEIMRNIKGENKEKSETQALNNVHSIIYIKCIQVSVNEIK